MSSPVQGPHSHVGNGDEHTILCGIQEDRPWLPRQRGFRLSRYASNFSFSHATHRLLRVNGHINHSSSRSADILNYSQGECGWGTKMLLRSGLKVGALWGRAVQDSKVPAPNCSDGCSQRMVSEGKQALQSCPASAKQRWSRPGIEGFDRASQPTRYNTRGRTGTAPFLLHITATRLLPDTSLSLVGRPSSRTRPVSFCKILITFANKRQDTCKTHLKTPMVISPAARRNWHWKSLLLLSWRGKRFPKLCGSTGNRNVCNILWVLNQICQVQFKWSKGWSQQQQKGKYVGSCSVVGIYPGRMTVYLTDIFFSILPLLWLCSSYPYVYKNRWPINWEAKFVKEK